MTLDINRREPLKGHGLSGGGLDPDLPLTRQAYYLIMSVRFVSRGSTDYFFFAIGETFPKGLPNSRPSASLMDDRGSEELLSPAFDPHTVDIETR